MVVQATFSPVRLHVIRYLANFDIDYEVLNTLTPKVLTRRSRLQMHAPRNHAACHILRLLPSQYFKFQIKDYT
jgi:hypothetical protein